MYKLGLEKADEPEIKSPTSGGSQKKQENSRKISTCALLIILKPLTVWITTKCGKFLKNGIPDHFTHMQIKKQQLEPYTEQLTGSKLGKG